MDIKTTVSGSLTKPEIEIIIKDFLKTKGYEVSSITFNIQMENQEDDFFSQYPQEPVFKGVEFICE